MTVITSLTCPQVVYLLKSGHPYNALAGARWRCHIVMSFNTSSDFLEVDLLHSLPNLIDVIRHGFCHFFFLIPQTNLINCFILLFLNNQKARSQAWHRAWWSTDLSSLQNPPSVSHQLFHGTYSHHSPLELLASKPVDILVHVHICLMYCDSFVDQVALQQRCHQ